MQTTLRQFRNPSQSFSSQVEVSNSSSLNFVHSIYNNQEVIHSLNTSLQTRLQEDRQEDKNIQKARKILGELAKDLTTEEVQDILTEVQYLADSWLDDFERQIFDGKTLKELLHERGRL